MSNVAEQLTPKPVNHRHGENGCCKNHRAWEMEMMHQVWAAGLHDAATAGDYGAATAGKSCALCILRWLRSPVEESEE